MKIYENLKCLNAMREYNEKMGEIEKRSKIKLLQLDPEDDTQMFHIVNIINNFRIAEVNNGNN